MIARFGFVSLAASVFAVLSVSAAARQPAEVKHTKDSPAKVKDLLKQEKAVLLDVREKDEWNAGHLKAADLVPLSKLRKSPDPKELEKTLGKDKIVYCHCRSGGRALLAAKILRELGYDCRPLKQGYQDLLAAGFVKAEKKKEKR